MSRIDLLAWCLKHEGAPYTWGAKGDLHPNGKISVPCFDCSGFVTAGITACGLPSICHKCNLGLRSFHGAQRIMDEWEPTTTPHALDVALYGRPGHANHVMFVWGDGRVYGASGGNSSTTSPQVAARIGACVKFKPSAGYRPDLLGYRVNPLA